MANRKYDSTVARIAGNIASGLAMKVLEAGSVDAEVLAHDCVELARAIVAEVERTEPVTEKAG